MNDYPTELELETIEKWECRSTNDMVELVEYIINIWWMKYGLSWTKRKVKNWYGAEYYKLTLSTGGWSGNESIIESLKANFFWPMCFYNHRVGGHYEFHVPIMKGK